MRDLFVSHVVLVYSTAFNLPSPVASVKIIQVALNKPVDTEIPTSAEQGFEFELGHPLLFLPGNLISQPQFDVALFLYSPLTKTP